MLSSTILTIPLDLFVQYLQRYLLFNDFSVHWYLPINFRSRYSFLTTIDQSSTTHLREELAHHLSGVVTLSKHPLPAIILRKCFPSLQRTTNHDSDTELVVSPPMRSTTQTAVPNDKVNNDKGKDDEVTVLAKKMQEKGARQNAGCSFYIGGRQKAPNNQK